MPAEPRAESTFRLLRHALLIASAAVLSIAACEKLTPGQEVGVPGGPILSGNGSDAGNDGGLQGSDAGLDAGLDGGLDGGFDAGPDGGQADAGPFVADGGCYSLNAFAQDNCFGAPRGQIRTVQISATGCGPATISLDTTPTCTGNVAPPNDAFTGFCGNLTCSAGGLPGTIFCPGTADGGTCTIVVCTPGGACP